MIDPISTTTIATSTGAAATGLKDVIVRNPVGTALVVVGTCVVGYYGYKYYQKRKQAKLQENLEEFMEAAANTIDKATDHLGASSNSQTT